jgi:deoxyribonuclease-1
MPAYWFGSQLQCWQDGGRKACKKIKAFKRMEGDMHNLVPAIGELNGDRSNYRFSMLEGEKRRYGQCDFEVEFKAKKAEPPEAVRGDIARTYFYMADRYKLKLSKSQRKLLGVWDRADPVDAWERKRNQKIKRIQGNANPFIQ